MQVSELAQLNHVRFPFTCPTEHPPLTSQQREDLLNEVLAHHAEQERQYLRTDVTWKNWQAAYQDYSAFGHLYLGSATNCWFTSTPSDVLVYFYKVLLPSHHGRQQDDAAGSTIKGRLSNLSMCFVNHDRIKPWDPDSCIGNPVLSRDVQNAVSVYCKMLVRQGVRERSAVPFTEAKLAYVVQQLYGAVQQSTHNGQATSAPSISTLVNIRDAALLTYMWHTMRRCNDALYINWENVHVKLGDQVVDAQSLWVTVSSPPFGKLLLVPSKSKTEHEGRPRTQELLSRDSTELTCGMFWLFMHFRWQLRESGRDRLSGPVFCSSRGNRFTTSAAINRIKTLLQRYGCYDGETMHSLRRGTLQHARAAGVPDAHVKALSGITTDEVLAVYMDEGRHLP